MAEKTNNPKGFSTCLEDTPFAEMMQRMSGQQGVGSLCAEMMRKVLEKQGDDCRITCAGMMQSMMQKIAAKKEKTKGSKEEGDHVGTE